MKIKEHITELLAGVIGTINALAVSEVVSPDIAMKLSVCVSVLTVWRGIVETIQLKKANSNES